MLLFESGLLNQVLYDGDMGGILGVPERRGHRMLLAHLVDSIYSP